MIAWNSLKEEKNNLKNLSFKTFISIIIPARNEESNIKLCIDSILEQDYPRGLLEIIIINDHSTDHTADIILSYRSPYIKLINLAEEMPDIKINSYKKKAIETGVKMAKGSLIVTTDADCIVSTKWLSGIATCYEKYDPYFIAAPVSFYRENNLFKIFQSLDFLTMQGITGGAVYKKFQCLCNGANLAYKKEIFYEVGGFKGIDQIASGDDMLLMHKIFSVYPDKVMFLKNKEVIVQTKPMESISGFLNQRVRWASKADKYKDKKITWVLILVYLFNVFLFITSIYTIFNPFYLTYCLLMWIIKILVEIIFIYPVSEFFNRKKLLFYFIPLQPFHVFYIIVSGWLGKFGNYIWKGRQVN